MKLLIAGSRSLKDMDISPYIPDVTDVIISGDAKGIDKLAEKYADEHKLSKFIMRPQYARYKKGAPIIRNQEMVDMCDRALIFWDGKSRGTLHTIEFIEKSGKPFQVVHCDDSE